VFLLMQANNLGLVDEMIEDMERQLLQEYVERERTPHPTFDKVSALSQLWVFGVFQKLLQIADRVRYLPREQREAQIASHREELPLWHYRSLVQAATDESQADRIRTALSRLERPFRRVEALRVNLAKHEMPIHEMPKPRRRTGPAALGAGYGRIDSATGSIWWMVPLRDHEVDALSRRDIARECRKLGNSRPVPLLTADIQTKLREIPEEGYGIQRVILVLDHGRDYECYVAWQREIVHVAGCADVPFDPSRVVGVRHAPSESEGT